MNVLVWVWPRWPSSRSLTFTESRTRLSITRAAWSVWATVWLRENIFSQPSIIKRNNEDNEEIFKHRILHYVNPEKKILRGLLIVSIIAFLLKYLVMIFLFYNKQKSNSESENINSWPRFCWRVQSTFILVLSTSKLFAQTKTLSPRFGQSSFIRHTSTLEPRT